MSFGTLKIDKADRAFSLYIRTRDNWTCVRCGRYDPNTEHEKSSMQCSHFYGRRKESVRFDEDNADCLDFGCHQIWGSDDRESYRAFKIKQLGQRRFDALMIKANTPQRKDRKLAFIYWNERFKQLESSGNS